MKYRANDFLAIRAKILKNGIFNSLLIANLSNIHTPVKVGNSLIRLEGRTRKLVKEQAGEDAKIPKYILVNILVIPDFYLSIEYSYKNFPPVFIRRLSFPNSSRITALKQTSSVVFGTYSIHASKIDGIFSKMPKSLGYLLESDKVSANYWKAGFAKKINEEAGKIDEKELDKYYALLNKRLIDWRIFNTILIELNKNGRFEIDKPGFGKIVVEKTIFDTQISIKFTSYIENSHISILSHYNTLNPPNWDNSNLDIFTLRKFFEEK